MEKKGAAPSKQLRPQEIESCPVEEGIALWFLGGPSMAIRTKESLLYLDLFTGPSPAPDIVTRAFPPVIDPEAIRSADIAISTHFDEDHCDWHALEFLHKNTRCLFLGPVSCCRLYQKWDFNLARQRQLAPQESFSRHDVAVHAYPSKDAFDPDALTYVIEAGGTKVFDGGDTLYFPGLAEIGERWELDIAFVSYAKNPEGRIYYLDEEAVWKAAQDLSPRILVLKHYDLWNEFAVDPMPLVKDLRSKGQDARVFGPGECFEYRGSS